jgi:hypothetical protein
MKETRTGHNRPVHRIHAITSPVSEMLPRDFDQIETAEDQARDWVGRGHYFSAEIPRNS